MPTETTLNSLKVHKVPDFETWEENYGQVNGIGTSDVVVIPPEELKKGVLPEQTGNSGKFLATDGTDASWETVDALPSQSGNSGKILTTNGTTALWANETDPVFEASPAAGITQNDIDSWDAKVSDDKTWNGVTLNKSVYTQISDKYIPFIYGSSTNGTTAYYIKSTSTPEQGRIAQYDTNSYLYSTTPSANDNSTKVATTAYVDAAIPNTSSFITTETDPTVPSWAKASTKPSYNASEVGAVATSAVGAANGVVPLNASSKIDSTYLPSYVDDVIEGYYYNSKFYTTSAHTTEITGETGKIFVDLSTNKTYRYGGSSFTEISQGSIVSVSRDLTSGTKIGTLTINGTNTDLYAPTPETFSVTGGASTIVSNNLTASRALISNSSGKVAVSDVTSTELGYLDGVTSAIQTQLDNKQAKITASGLLKGNGSGGVSAATAGTDYQAPLTFDGSTTTKYLSQKGTWENAPEDIFYCHTSFLDNSNPTSYADAVAAYQAGKLLVGLTKMSSDSSKEMPMYFINPHVFSPDVFYFMAYSYDYGTQNIYKLDSTGWSKDNTFQSILVSSSNSGKVLSTSSEGYLEWQTVDSTPTNESSNPVNSDGTYDMIMGRTKIYTGSCSTAAATAAKVVTLDDATGFSKTAGVMVLVRFTYGNSATTPTLNVNSTSASNIAIPSSATAYTTGNGTTYNTWGAYESILFTYTGTYWTHIPSGYLGYLAYNLANSKQDAGNYKTIQTAVTDPTASGNSTTFIDSISQNTNGVISVTKKNVNFPVTSVNSKTGAVTLTASDVGALPSSTTIPTVPTMDASPTDGNSSNTVSSNGVYDMVMGRTKVYTATCSTAAATTAKVATLDDSTNFSLTAGVKVAVTFTYGNSATTPTLNVNSSGAKTIAIPSSATAFTTGNGTTYNTWGAYETVLFTYTGTYWAHDTSGYLGYLAYNTASGRQAKITASGILKGDGAGGVTAATVGTDYQAPLPSQSGNSGKYLTTNGTTLSWDTVSVPSASTTTPSMDGTASYGSGTTWARADHVHPSDTNKQDKITASGVLQGNGSGGITAKTVDTAPASSSSNLITSGALYNSVKRTDSIDAANTDYSTVMARGIYATTTDLTAGTTSLTNGVIALVYEV